MSYSNDFQILNGNRYNIIAVEIGSIKDTTEKSLFAVPEELPPKMKGITIDDVIILSDTTTKKSDAENNYSFQVKNLTNSEDLLVSPAKTSDQEISGNSIFSIKPDQNNENLIAGTVLELQITKNGNPTDLSDAEIVAVVYWHWEIKEN